MSRVVNYTSFYSVVSFIFLFHWDLFGPIFGQYPTSRNGPPRFKQNARLHQYAYLGDNVKFKCTAVGRPQPKVHWYRNGAYLNYSFMQAHTRFTEKSMSLEIRRIEVGDKGNWMCRVWNNEGSTTRNFTLHIVDFCDYFLNMGIDVDQIPEECLCQWALRPNLTGHAPPDLNVEDDVKPIILVPLPMRTDVNLHGYNATRCAGHLRRNASKFNRAYQQHNYLHHHTHYSNTTTSSTLTTVSPKLTSLARPRVSAFFHELRPKPLLTINSTLLPVAATLSTMKPIRVHSALPTSMPHRMRFIIDDGRRHFREKEEDRTFQHVDGTVDHRPMVKLVKPVGLPDAEIIRNPLNVSKMKSSESQPNISQYSSRSLVSSVNIIRPVPEKSVRQLPIFLPLKASNVSDANLYRNNNNIIAREGGTNTAKTWPTVYPFLTFASTPRGITLTRFTTTPSTDTTISTPAVKNPVEMFDHLMESGIPDVSHLLPELVTSNEMTRLRDALLTHWNPHLDVNAKMELAERIVGNLSMDREIEAGSEEAEQDEDDAIDYQHLKRTTLAGTPILVTITPDSVLEYRPIVRNSSKQDALFDGKPSGINGTNATKKWPQPPSRVAPYFRQPDDETKTTIVLPAGRTLKLSCKAGGQPEPQVLWRKDGEEIERDSESRTGSPFHIRKWSVELEDASELDSGDYECEVFNVVGALTRHFRVDIRDRLRSRPILVPNVLLNQTIDVNNTVNFTCQVISDLVPHIVWIKLVMRNGSYIRMDPKTNQQSFNFVDMSTVRKARIFHNNDTNRYTLEIVNVTMEDQGIYSCIAGNTLGMSMANATLTVNEFRSMTLPTENPYQWPLSYTVLIVLSVLLLMALLMLSLLYYFFSRKFSKNRIQNLDKMSVRKKVIITKKLPKDGDIWSDLASSYAITVEPVINNSSSGEQRHTQLSSDDTLLSNYEVPTDVAYEIDRNRLELSDVLGEGAFGEVWKGMLRDVNNSEDKTPVAVKKLKPAAHEKELLILVSEMEIFKCIGKHPNILQLVGCCTGIGPLLVVLELCPHGNLRDFLRKHRPREDLPEPIADEKDVDDDEVECVKHSGGDRKSSSEDYLEPRRVMYQNVEATATTTIGGEAPIKNLTLKDLVRFATEVARGMEFLASQKIIHRDLAARNVLVSENYIMKISDFGLSRSMIYQDYYRKKGAGRLPIKWMAPEALEANVYTVYSDVWSYGILLWEIMTLGGTPYPSIAMPQLYNILKEGYRMEAPHNCPEEIYGVMVMCWQEKPELRPQFQTIADYFDWMLVEAANYTSKSDDGETTDEGPYAVINEGLNNASQIGGASGRRVRPLSAPGMMSFEAFAIRESESRKPNSSETQDHFRGDYLDSAVGGGVGEVEEEVDDENCPLLLDVNRKPLFHRHLSPPASARLGGSCGGIGSLCLEPRGGGGGDAGDGGALRKKSSLIAQLKDERTYSAKVSRKPCYGSGNNVSHSNSNGSQHHLVESSIHYNHPETLPPRFGSATGLVAHSTGVETNSLICGGHLYSNTVKPSVLTQSKPDGAMTTRYGNTSDNNGYFVDSAIGSPLVLSPLDPLTVPSTSNDVSAPAAMPLLDDADGDEELTERRKRSVHDYVNELIKLSPTFSVARKGKELPSTTVGGGSSSADFRMAERRVGSEFGSRRSMATAASAEGVGNLTQPSTRTTTAASSTKSLHSSTSSSSSSSNFPFPPPTPRGADTVFPVSHRVRLHNAVGGNNGIGAEAATTPSDLTITTFANTAIVSSANTAIAPLTSASLSTRATPTLNAAKRSVESERALRVHPFVEDGGTIGGGEALFKGIGQQMSRQVGSDGIGVSHPGSSGMSSFGSTTLASPSSTPHNHLFNFRSTFSRIAENRKACNPDDDPSRQKVSSRSESMDSRSSSGRGGSSVMSSAEALPENNNGVQLKPAAVEPTVEYVTVHSSAVRSDRLGESYCQAGLVGQKR